MPVPEYIKTKDEYVYYAGDGEFLLFIPEIYFERAIAVIEGEFIEKNSFFYIGFSNNS